MPTSVGTTESAKTQATLPQDIPTVFQPHDPSSNASTDSNHQPSSKGNAYPPQYNVSSNDPHPTNSVDHDKKDYPEIPDNEIGENSAANSAKDGTSTKGSVGVGIPQPNGNGDGNMALVTTIPIVAILAIILITAATLYLVNRRNRIKKRPVKEIVRKPYIPYYITQHFRHKLKYYRHISFDNHYKYEFDIFIFYREKNLQLRLTAIRQCLERVNHQQLFSNGLANEPSPTDMNHGIRMLFQIQ